MGTFGRVLRIAACAVAGAILLPVLIDGVVRAANARYPVRWEKLAGLPAEITRLVGGPHGTMYAETSSGIAYRWRGWSGEGWTECDIPEPDESPLRTVQPCDFAVPPLSWSANPPRDPVQCVQSEEIHVDCVGRDAYAVDANGDIWGWSYTVCAQQETLCAVVVSPFLGAGVGVGIGAYWDARARSRRAHGEAT